MKRFLFLIATSWSFVVAGHAQCPDRYLDVETDSFILHQDLYFGENVSENGELTTLLLDVFEPVLPSEEQRPMVIMVHGGSFTGGSKGMGEVRWFCEDLAKRGILTASINYRVESNPLSLLSKEKMVKAVVRAVEDIKASVRYFYKHIDEGNEWNIDPEAIFLGGTSAGSIGNLHAVFMDEYSTLDADYKQWILDLGIDTIGMHGNSGNPGYSERIAGLINISGAIASVDFLNNNADIPIINIHNAIDLAVPYTYGYPYFIPTLPIVAGSRPIHFRMDSIGGVTQLITIPGINHIPHTGYDGEQLQPIYDNLLTAILQFVAINSPCSQIITAVQEASWNRINTYPNPVSDHFYIEGLSEGDDFQFDLISLDGAVVMQNLKANGGLVTLAGPPLPPGMYFLRGIGPGPGEGFTTPLIVQ